VNLETSSPMPSVMGRSAISGFSGAAVRPSALRFVAELRKDPEIASRYISGIGGISTWENAMEFFLLGATNVQVCTSAMLHGYRIVEDIIDGTARYLTQRQMTLKDLIGRSVPNIIDPGQLDIKHEVVAKINSQLCVGCGRCIVACRDGANQAIEFASEGKTGRVARVDPNRCIGCTLCQHVCPVADLGCIEFDVRERIHH